MNTTLMRWLGLLVYGFSTGTAGWLLHELVDDWRKRDPRPRRDTYEGPDI